MSRLARLRKARTDSGMVTVEAALVMPVMFLLLSLMIATLAVVNAKMRAVDASREAARLAARGESAAAVAAGQRLGPQHATVVLQDRSHWVQAVVTAEVRLFGSLPPLTVSAATLAEREDP
jgi:Flp pilus assembly protein TadG